MSIDTLYFAYGSNLNQEDLDLFCNRTGRPGATLEPLGPAYLPDYRPVYHYRSHGREGGALDVTPASGHITPGILFRTTEADWNLLDKKEGAPRYYQRTPVTVLNDSGGMHQATTYCVVRSHRESEFIAPSSDYSEIVHNGLLAWNLDTRAHDLASIGEVPDFGVRHLFVYGLLRSDQELSHKLDGIGQRTAARTPGRLYDLGNYPGWLPAKQDNEWVQGELLALDTPDKTLEISDRIEGFLGYDDNALYHRVLVQATVSDGATHLAWCYRYARPVTGLPLSGGFWPLQ